MSEPIPSRLDITKTLAKRSYTEREKNNNEICIDIINDTLDVGKYVRYFKNLPDIEVLHIIKNHKAFVNIYLDNIAKCSAYILNYCRDGELFFIGRSPENIYDFLCGAFDKFSTWRERLHYVIISMRGYTDYNSLTSEQSDAIKSYLTQCGLHPKDIIQRKRRTCLVDFIYSGGTLLDFTSFLKDWTKDERLSVKDMQYKIEFILMEKESHKLESITTDAHCFVKEFVNDYGWGKNSYHLISVPDNFWYNCAEYSSKSIESYTVEIWGNEKKIKQLKIDSFHNEGERNARISYLYGKHIKGKQLLRKYIIKCPAMRYKWFTTILSGLNNKPIKIHDSVHQVNMTNKRRRQKSKKGTIKCGSVWISPHQLNFKKIPTYQFKRKGKQGDILWTQINGETVKIQKDFPNTSI
jgi:hypothetical protein